MKVVLATHNPAKVEDYQKVLKEHGLEVETLNSLNIKENFEENQDTFKENAKSKALFYYKLAKMSTLADDGGFEIDYLHGEPGVKSRRWLGYEASDEEIVNHLVEVIDSISENQRTAKFTTVLCLVKSPKEIYFAKNSIEGFLTTECHLDYPKGFPYRACFIEKTFGKHLMDLSEAEYNQINHRRRNVEEIIKNL